MKNQYKNIITLVVFVAVAFVGLPVFAAMTLDQVVGKHVEAHGGEAAWKANQDGRFVSFPGLEWTKEWGHINIYDPKVRRWPVDPQAFYKACAELGVIAKFNHPGDGTESHGGLEYSEIGDQAVQLMEVRKAEEEQAYIRALDRGYLHIWHLIELNQHPIAPVARELLVLRVVARFVEKHTPFARS